MVFVSLEAKTLSAARAISGGLTHIMTITLNADSTSTPYYDSQINVNSYVGLEPLTSSAAYATTVLGGVSVVPNDGHVMIYHPTNPATDQTFKAAVLGPLTDNGVYVVPGDGEAVIHHPSNPATDMAFVALIIS